MLSVKLPHLNRAHRQCVNQIHSLAPTLSTHLRHDGTRSVQRQAPAFFQSYPKALASHPFASFSSSSFNSSNLRQSFSRLWAKWSDFYPKESGQSDKPDAPNSTGSEGANGNTGGSGGDSSGGGAGKGGGAGGGGGGGSGGSGGGGKKNFKMSEQGWLLVLIAGGVALIPLLSSGPSGTEISFAFFRKNILAKGQVSELQVNPDLNIVYVKLKSRPNVVDSYFTVGSVETFERNLETAQHELGLDPQDVPVKFHRAVEFDRYITMGTSLVIVAILISQFSSFSGAGGKSGGRSIFNVGKSGATMVKPGERTKITFKDVAGLDEAKVEIMEFVSFLKNTEKFKRLGARIPKGALLVGPPGTGKTLLAKATAGEASVPFFSISGSDFIEMFVGVGPARVRDLFKQARENQPCIVFIDEIDAVGRARNKGSFSGGNDERENTLNQLLVEMDGFNEQENVVVLAGTNRMDILDKALLRPGRFDRHIQIDKPDINGRRQIFLVHLKPLKLVMDINEVAQRMAALTPGFAGADISNICNEAALIAARQDKAAVDLVDFEQAVDRVIAGLEKKNNVLSVAEKKLVAYHEAGHAVAGWFLEHANPLLKVTIVPRSKGSLGFAQYLPKELALYQQDQLLDMMCTTLGGRAAEQIFFGKISTGAADDLDKVTKLAYNQIAVYGMSARLGNVSFQQREGESFTKPYSENTAQMIDEEVSKLIRSAYDRVMVLIEEKKELVERLALVLLEKETVNHDVIIATLGKRPFTTDAYNTYLQQQDLEAQKLKDKLAAEQAKIATEQNKNSATVSA